MLFALTLDKDYLVKRDRSLQILWCFDENFCCSKDDKLFEVVFIVIMRWIFGIDQAVVIRTDTELFNFTNFPSGCKLCQILKLNFFFENSSTQNDKQHFAWCLFTFLFRKNQISLTKPKIESKYFAQFQLRLFTNIESTGTSQSKIELQL